VTNALTSSKLATGSRSRLAALLSVSTGCNLSAIGLQDGAGGGKKGANRLQKHRRKVVVESVRSS
jgi:hypothetical protein